MTAATFVPRLAAARAAFTFVTRSFTEVSEAASDCLTVTVTGAPVPTVTSNRASPASTPVLTSPVTFDTLTVVPGLMGWKTICPFKATAATEPPSPAAASAALTFVARSSSEVSPAVSAWRTVTGTAAALPTATLKWASAARTPALKSNSVPDRNRFGNCTTTAELPIVGMLIPSTLIP